MCISTNDVDTDEVKDYLLAASYNTGKTIVNQFITKSNYVKIYQKDLWKHKKNLKYFDNQTQKLTSKKPKPKCIEIKSDRELFKRLIIAAEG